MSFDYDYEHRPRTEHEHDPLNDGRRLGGPIKDPRFIADLGLEQIYRAENDIDK
jgi:hypothetical protein